jgi:uncharacterized protein (TIGR02594 family)
MRAVILATSFVLLATCPSFAQGFDPDHSPAVHGFMKGAGTPWLKEALRDVGTNPTGWSHKWCGKQMNTWLQQTGRQGTGSNTAASFARYGQALSGPKVGAIAVMSHHVGIVENFDASSVTLVSGNNVGRSGHRTVGVGRYPRSRIIAYRWPD